MTVNISVKGIPEVRRFLKEKNIKGLKLVDEGIDKSALFLLGEIKQSIAGHRAEIRSVDTGRFLSSIRKNKEKALQASVSSDVKHAKFLEYGTSEIAPRRHFRNSGDRNRKKIIEIIKKELNSVQN